VRALPPLAAGFACEREDSLRAALAVIDQLALAVMTPAGRA
jgi:hypothetical protein